jgi:GT2 family glycosyltransferase
MVYENGKIQHTARRFRSIWWELLDVIRFIPLALPYRKRAKLMLGKYFKADYNLSCDWVNGAFFMFAKSALSRLPNQQLDERFFMYGEDHLWCYQFGQLGLKCHFLSDTTIVHINNGSTRRQQRLQLIKVMIKNELKIMQERKGNGWYYFVFCCIYLTKEYGRYTIKWLAMLFRSKLRLR